MNSNSTSSYTPMQLIFRQYETYIVNKANKTYNRENDNSYLMVESILRKNVGIDDSYMDIAVNFPDLLKCILNKNPEYYEILANKVKIYFDINFTRMSFLELILTSGDEIITQMMEKESCQQFLQDYHKEYGQTPLHIAAKLSKPLIVEKMMKLQM